MTTMLRLQACSSAGKEITQPIGGSGSVTGIHLSTVSASSPAYNGCTIVIYRGSTVINVLPTDTKYVHSTHCLAVADPGIRLRDLSHSQKSQHLHGSRGDRGKLATGVSWHI